MMRSLACLTSLFALLVTEALANTEKVIFIAPPKLSLPDSGPQLASLGLATISAQNSRTLKTALSVAFPSTEKPRGLDSWYILSNLSNGHRSEVRICWTATQPTEFWLDVFDIAQVFDTPALIQSLSTFAEDRTNQLEQEAVVEDYSRGSILFLRVQAAADYFTTNKSLMQQPPLVDVEIILDHYLLNVFPESLVPTAIYLIFLATLAFFASGHIWHFLTRNRLKQRQD